MLIADSQQVIAELIEYLNREVGESIPSIAAGGIWSRQDIDLALSLGAAGVQIGTRFITTDECDAHVNYKLFHLEADPEDIAIVPSPLGIFGRVLNHNFAKRAISHDSKTIQGLIMAAEILYIIFGAILLLNVLQASGAVTSIHPVILGLY